MDLVLVSGSVLVIGSLFMVAVKFNEIFNYKKLKNLNSLDVIVNESTGELEIENEEDRKVISYYIKKVYNELDILYTNNSWENKRVLYSIISSISDLKDNVEFNSMTDKDMEMINSVMCIYRVSMNNKKNIEKIIFEWQYKYIK